MGTGFFPWDCIVQLVHGLLDAHAIGVWRQSKAASPHTMTVRLLGANLGAGLIHGCLGRVRWKLQSALPRLASATKRDNFSSRRTNRDITSHDAIRERPQYSPATPITSTPARRCGQDAARSLPPLRGDPDPKLDTRDLRLIHARVSPRSLTVTPPAASTAYSTRLMFRVSLGSVNSGIPPRSPVLPQHNDFLSTHDHTISFESRPIHTRTAGSPARRRSPRKGIGPDLLVSVCQHDLTSACRVKDRDVDPTGRGSLVAQRGMLHDGVREAGDIIARRMA